MKVAPFKVSVIIPVYNTEKYVTKAVDSARSLSVVGEILLIDDGSVDNSYQLCKTLEKEHSIIRVLQHPDKKNHGPAASRNLGILNAHQDYIAFLDADDYYLPNRFSYEKRIFQAELSTDVVYGCSHTIFITAEGREKYYNYETSDIYTLSQRVPPETLFNALLFYQYGRLHTSAITIKKEVLNKTGLFNEKLKWAEDTELWLKLSLKTKMVAGNIETPISHRCIHNDNIVHQTGQAAFYKNKMYRSLFKWSLKQHFPFEIANNIFNTHKSYLIAQKKLSNRASFFGLYFIKDPTIIFYPFFWKKLKLTYFNNKSFKKVTWKL